MSLPENSSSSVCDKELNEVTLANLNGNGDVLTLTNYFERSFLKEETFLPISHLLSKFTLKN